MRLPGADLLRVRNLVDFGRSPGSEKSRLVGALGGKMGANGAPGGLQGVYRGSTGGLQGHPI